MEYQWLSNILLILKYLKYVITSLFADVPLDINFLIVKLCFVLNNKINKNIKSKNKQHCI